MAGALMRCGCVKVFSEGAPVPDSDIRIICGDRFCEGIVGAPEICDFGTGL